MPDELWMEVNDIIQETEIKTIPMKKKCKKKKKKKKQASVRLRKFELMSSILSNYMLLDLKSITGEKKEKNTVKTQTHKG